MANHKSDPGYDTSNLRAAGFTPAGIKRFNDTLRAYSQELFDRSLAFGKAVQERGQAPEITHEYVRSAALAMYVNRPGRSTKWIACQAGEYLSTAIAGAGAGYGGQGYYAFVLGCVLATLLFVLRQIYNK